MKKGPTYVQDGTRTHEKFVPSWNEFAKKLLLEKKVAVVPGSAFSTNGNRYIRISYASSFENIKEALFRIEEFINSV